MPGRLCIYDDLAFKEDITAKFGTFRDDVGILHKQYNIAPTLDIPIYIQSRGYTTAHFGLITSWAKSRSSMQVNARSESVFQKSSFKEAYRQRRCLIPVNGYYEWQKEADTKKPHLIVSQTDTYFAFAGIYETWYDNELKKPILTCALLTTEPNEKIAAIHDRMPVILESQDWKLWLDERSSYHDLNSLYAPLESERMRYYPVSDIVNSVKNDSVECIQEAAHIAPRQETLF